MEPLLLPAHLWCYAMPRHHTAIEAGAVWRRLRGGGGPPGAFRADTSCCSLDKVQSVLDYARFVLQFKIRTLSEQLEFVANVVQSLARSTSEGPCQRTVGGALRHRAEALTEAVDIARRGFRLVRRAARVTLASHCLMPRGALGYTEAAHAAWRGAKRLAALTLRLALSAARVFDADKRAWEEAGEEGTRGCFPLPFVATLDGVAFHLPSKMQALQGVWYPFARPEAGVRTWHAWVDRFSLSLSRLAAKLAYQLKAITASLEPTYGQGPMYELFWGGTLLTEPGTTWRWPNHGVVHPLHIGTGEEDRSQAEHVLSRFALVVLVSNRTGTAALQDAWHGVELVLEALEGVQVLWLEDAIREPWVTTYRPEHSVFLTQRSRSWKERTASIDLFRPGTVQVVWRRFQATLTNLEVAALHLVHIEQCSDALIYDIRNTSDTMTGPTLIAGLRHRATHNLLAPPMDKPVLSYIKSSSVRTMSERAAARSGLPWTLEQLGPYISLHRRFVRILRGRQGELGASARTLVYVCNPFSLCGGHGDRTNGIISAFVLALLTSRCFFIDFDSPLPLNMLLQPRRGMDGQLIIDWRLHAGAVGSGSQSFYLDDRIAFQEDLGWLVRDPSPTLLVSMNHRELEALLSHPLLATRARELGLHGWVHLSARLWDLLFEPTPLLRTRLQAAQAELKLGGPLPWLPGVHGAGARAADGNTLGFVGIHFRAGNESRRSWWDPGRHPLSSLPSFLECAAQAEADVGLPDDTKWFLSSDTAAALEAVPVVRLRRRGKVVTLDGDSWPIAHVDRSHVNLGLQGFAESYTSYLLLASARVVVLSRSFFGETAAEVGAVPSAYFAEGCVRVDLHAS